MPERKDLPVPWELTRLNLARYIYHCPTIDVENMDSFVVSIDLKLLEIEQEIEEFKKQNTM